MSVTFDVYRRAQGGQRELVCITQSAHKAREVRDGAPGEMLVLMHDDAAVQGQPLRERPGQGHAVNDGIEGDYLI
jgi:hypothetical protein